MKSSKDGDMLAGLFFILSVIFFLVWGLSAAFGQSAADASPYHGLTNARNGSCCGPTDCRPGEAVRRVNDPSAPDIIFEVEWRGRWLPVREWNVSKTPSWDADFHMCIGNQYGPEPYVVCFIMPGTV